MADTRDPRIDLGGVKLDTPSDYSDFVGRVLVFVDLSVTPLEGDAAARVMKKHNIPTLDLFTPSKNNMKDWMRKADVHYYPHGSQALAGLVAKDIIKRLKK